MNLALFLAVISILSLLSLHIFSVLCKARYTSFALLAPVSGIARLEPILFSMVTDCASP
ncbi:hypothetical protein [Treponema sp. R8-4-B8]